MSYQGDIQLGDTIFWTFTTVGTDGAPTAIAGSPTVTAYTDANTTQSATGCTIGVDHDGITGLNLITIVATGGNGFATGESISIVLEGTGTVGGTSITGYTAGTFSIERNPVNWNLVAGASTTVDLSATTTSIVDTATAVTAVSANGITSSSMAADSIATGVIATDAIGVLAMAAGSISAGTIASGELTNIENEIWDALKAAHTTPDSFGDFLDDEITSRQVSGAVDLNADQSGVTVGTVNLLAANAIATGVMATDSIGILAMAANSISAGTIASGELTNIENEIWDALKSAHVVANSFGDFLDIEVSGRLASADISLTGGAVDTVTAVTNDVGITATAVNLFWDEAMTETTGAPAVTASFREALKWMFALSRNEINQTATLTTLRNDADSGDLATSVVSDDATTYTRAEWST